jgi:hypothetical protein
MRFMAAMTTAAAVVCSGVLAGPAVASETSPRSQFPVWQVVWRGPNAGLGSVTATGPTDAWAAGIALGARGYLLHWDGRRWRTRAVPATGMLPLVVRASSPSNVWVFGPYRGSGAAFRWDGSRWHQTTLGAAGGFGEAAVLGPSNVWFATPDCSSGAVCPAYHWNGSSWAKVTLPRRFVLTGLSGSSPRNIWVAGYLQARPGVFQGPVAAYRWRNGSWSAVRLPRESGSRVSVAAVAPSNVWILMGLTDRPRPLHWNGTRWQRLPSPPQAISAIPPIAPFGRNGIRVGATALWNGRSWQFGPSLPDGWDMASIPGTASAWMVGAWPAPRTGLTAEVRFSR